ncbi:MAG: hypothetical protein K8F52_07455 [Candidatus Scalindua rubra]|nr:hypothetical protein [Candidatus Scalindua rubra]
MCISTDLYQWTIEYLRNFHFSGDLYVVPEGTVIFANEPIISVTASIIEAQIIETYLLSIAG